LSVDSHGPIFEAAAREWNVDPRLLRAVATQESGGNPNARSRAGAVGVMQIMPGTAKDLGVTDLTNAEQSIYGGAKYLSQMLDKYKHPELALAAYNAGPGRVDAFLKGGALPDETLKYVPAIKAHYERLGPVADRRASGVMSDDDFLKAIGGGAKPATTAPGATISDDDFLKAIAPTTEAKPAPTDKRQQGDPDNPVMPQRFQRRADLGPRSSPAVEAGTTVGDIAASAGNIGSAAAQGFREGSQPMPPLVTPVMEGLGVYPPAAGGGTLLQRANKLVMDPLAAGGELALRLGGGVIRGLQAGVTQAGREGGDAPMLGVLGSPQQLGRDLAAMPDAFMGALPGGAPRQPNRLAPAVPEYVPLPDKPRVYMRADIGETRAAPEFMPPGVQRPPAAPVAPPDFLPPGATMAPAADDAAMGGRRSAGAAAATDAEANMSPRERKAAEKAALYEKLTEPQPLGPDLNEYIPGIIRTEAEIMQDPKIARNEKMLEAVEGARFKEAKRKNTETRMEYLKDLAGNPNVLERMMQQRDTIIERDLPAVWRNAGAADVEPILVEAQRILDSPSGRQSAVEKSVQHVVDRLTDKKTGKPFTDPQQLYGVRKEIGQLLEGKQTQESGYARLAKSELIAFRDALDTQIEKAAPGFTEYLAKYREASKPIDETAYLIDAANDAMKNRTLTLQSVQRMMQNIADDRSAFYPNAAQSISLEKLEMLWRLRDDLRAVANAEDLAKARGSDTTPLIVDLMKNVGGRTLVEGVGMLASGMPGASLVFNGIKAASERNKLAKGLDRAFTSGQDRLRPPPQ